MSNISRRSTCREYKTLMAMHEQIYTLLLASRRLAEEGQEVLGLEPAFAETCNKIYFLASKALTTMTDECDHLARALLAKRRYHNLRRSGTCPTGATAP